MIDVVGISFGENHRVYYFSLNHLDVKKGKNVIVETERGLQYGTVVTEIISMDEQKLKFPLKPLIRIANKKDREQYKKNLHDAERALKKCKDLVIKHKLNMKVMDAAYTFDRDQLLFHFLADNRVDFRALAKELASIYRTRIELRQVGVRDKAREIGGYGPCGKKLCCSQFLYEFDSVSMNMAKNQNISLNPSKINGVCGRLLCCLKYEDETYTEYKETLPKVGKKVVTEQGEGTVTKVDILNQSYTVDIPSIGLIEVESKDGSN